MTPLKTQIIPISKGQYFGDLFEQIPYNVIIDKTLPGIRATSKEIETERNTILLESNVPVIKDKCRKYKDKHIIGVYKDSPDDLEDYLTSNVQYKKIMVTPESFSLVMAAMREAGIDVYNDYFLLWDECERTIQDIYYRGRIILPIDEVFKFRHKAFISATALPPRDPRFVEQDFTYIKLKPDFDYKQSIKLIHSDNVETSLKKYIQEYPSEKYFIFLNSTRTIASIQKALGIKDESFTFCAYESSLRLKLSKYPNCSPELQTFKKYNFFTSRFFSAVDIEFEGDPSIIMITDLVYARHSKIDPYSEAVQIIGRFRKPIGTIDNVCHITNTDPSITYKRPEQTGLYLKQHEFLYNNVKSLLHGATELGSVTALREALTVLPWSKYINDDETVNYFMIDNTYFEEKVNSYYQNIENLIQAYEDCGYFNVKYSEETYVFTDTDRRKTDKSTLKNVARLVIQHLHKLQSDDYSQYQQFMETQVLEEHFPAIVKFYKELGFSTCRLLKYNIKAMESAVKKQSKNKETGNFEFIRTIKRLFQIGKSYSSTDIKTILMQAIHKHSLFLLTANVQLLRQYFELSDRHTIGYREDGGDIKGYTLLEAKFL
jgi:hypothetical protein